ncbi:MAG TPA: hypothetical protein VLI46_06205 [Ramlibacter sp.]|nr:hypothetical protein [Ramlibacter sp.]
MGLPVALAEAIGLRDPPFEKRWETLGEPHLLVIGAYAMGLRIEPHPRGALLTVSIDDYELPTDRPWRWLGRLLGPRYARWCCERMLKDAQHAFEADGTSAPRA